MPHPCSFLAAAALSTAAAWTLAPAEAAPRLLSAAAHGYAGIVQVHDAYRHKRKHHDRGYLGYRGYEGYHGHSSGYAKHRRDGYGYYYFYNPNYIYHPGYPAKHRLYTQPNFVFQYSYGGGDYRFGW